MSCCGKKRTQSEMPVVTNPVERRLPARANTTTRVASPALAASGSVWFEYFGAGTLTVVGPVTQRRYTFASYGARAAVDARDRLSLRSVPHLRESR